MATIALVVVVAFLAYHAGKRAQQQHMADLLVMEGISPSELDQAVEEFVARRDGDGLDAVDEQL